MTASDLVAALRPVVETLEALGVSYYLTGSVASSAHGVARTSVDADIVVALDQSHLEPLVERLQTDYYVPVDRLQWAVTARSSCNLIHLATMFKIDLFVARDRPFDREAAQRARPEAVDDTPDAPVVPIASAEDTTLSTLEWFRRRGETSERQWWDVLGMLKVRLDLDREYVRRWAGPLGVADLVDIPPARVVEVPDWAMREPFDIRAVMPEGATEQDTREMLKTLLADRFGLRIHVEQRPYPVFELIVGPSGPRFPEVEVVDELQKDFAGEPGTSASDRTSQLPRGEVRSITRFEPDGLRFVTVTAKMRYSYKLLEGEARQLDAERITMEEFSRLLSVERPVVDKTGLVGVYRFKTLLPPIPLSARMQALLGDRVSPNPSIPLSRAVEELGLKLEPKNTPVDHIVVDRIERPTPN